MAPTVSARPTATHTPTVFTHKHWNFNDDYDDGWEYHTETLKERIGKSKFQQGHLKNLN